MKYISTLLLSLACATTLLAQDLDFNAQTPLYPDAALSNTYTNIGSPATNVKVTLASNATTTSGLFQTNYPKRNTNGLALNMNFEENTECLTVTIAFSPGVVNPSFILYDIDRGSVGPSGASTYNYVDQVTVAGTSGPASVTPTIGASSIAGANSVVGNVITGVAAGVSPRNLVTFSGFVTEITIQYCNGANTRVNPGVQAITLGDISWDDALPVRLTLFRAQLMGDRVELGWETAAEENAQSFSVERSRDAQSFEPIGTVAAKGFSETGQLYNFTDATPLAGNNYYRLRQTDRNGAVEYSKVIVVKYEVNALYYTAAWEGGTQLIIHTNAQEPVFMVYSMQGVSQLKQVEALGTNQYRLHLVESVQPGLYLVKLQTGTTAYTRNVLIGR